MSSSKLETVDNNTKLELETFAGATIQAWKDAAREAKLVLRASNDGDSGDYPESVYSQLRRFRTVISKSKGEPNKVITHMARQLVSTRDDKGKPVKKEYLTYQGYYEVKDFRGVPYNADLEAGKYQKPKVVVNPGRRFNPETGEPIGPEFIFSGSEIVYIIEVPKSKTERKKLIDEIIGDNEPESIKYYFKSFDELARRDPTFSYDDFVNYSIEELRKLSFQGGGSLTPGIWRDSDGKLRDKFGQLLTQASGNKEAYQ
jgi:hypothetical protein